MLRYLMAALLAASPAAAASVEDSKDGGWALAAMPTGCMVQAVSPEGTMLSVWGFAGDSKLGFLLQNRGWEVRDGEKTPLRVEFPGGARAGAWPVEATARAHIDSDGPGLYFTIEPGGAGANAFLAAFASAEGMRISRAGADVDTLPLAGSRGAISSLAACLAERWNEAAEGGEPKPAEPRAGTI